MATRGEPKPDSEKTKDTLGRRVLAKKRTATQEPNAKGEHAGMTVNITETGAAINDILAGDEVYVCVHENGIIIQPDDE